MTGDPAEMPVVTSRWSVEEWKLRTMPPQTDRRTGLTAVGRDRLDELYELHILPHAQDTGRRGRLQNATCSATRRNPRCGDEVRLDLVIGDTGHVCAAHFDARGCLISQAAADLLCEFLEGKAVDEICGFTAQEMLKLLRVPLTPGRLQCGLLAFEALKTMTDSLAPQAVR